LGFRSGKWCSSRWSFGHFSLW